ncbi:EAL domain-containing protein [Paenalkalicoccus suaedae]|uniref:EAL domain-containing protein n=1 Tax=Paenalkalicoccus suaedae TaxID=2592382 RepID=A0A859FIB5_9BACI|nr:EAL domain-containing protein [Paenalkalicoccus suaedae]QKS72412.1 EAL domain-containing protein [Paenalkalicoccus suaedae]
MESSLLVLDTLYNWPLVVFSVLVAIIGSFVAIEINNRLSQKDTTKSSYMWIAIGALTMGVSIWGMHFIGMAAFQLYVPLTYDWILTALSIIPAIIASFIAFFVIHKTKITRLKILIAGITMGLGIVAMHYAGMRAITFAGVIEHDVGYVATASAIAIVVSFVALFLFSFTKGKNSLALRSGIAVLMGLAISSMHYTGMSGSEFCLPPDLVSLIQPTPVQDNTILGATTLFATGIIFIGVQFILINEKKWAEALHYSDPITRLPNRRSFDQLSPKDIEHYGSAIILDIEDFTLINESYGGNIGDDILVGLGETVKDRTSSQTKLFKLDGSRFTFFMKELDPKLLRANLKLLISNFTYKFPESDEKIDITLNCGVTHLNKNELDLQKLHKELEIALRAARRDPINNIMFYDEQKEAEQREDILLTELRLAILRGEIDIFYQPKVSFETLEVHKVEALARWNSAKLGFVSPGEFIPLAERHGLIMQLTEYVVQQSCEQLVLWKEEKHSVNQIAINLSPTHFQIPDSNKRLIEIIRAHSINPSQIEFEITETSMMQSIERAEKSLDELRSIGFSIALDDFGTGLSSLTYLQRLPINTLKIDKSFIDSLLDCEKDAAIVKLIIDFAKTINMETVCEGVETLEQAILLQKMGCQYAQGYYYQKPVPANDITSSFECSNDMTS